MKAAIEVATLPPATRIDDRIAAAKKVREQFPEDYFAHRFYQELFVKQGLFSQPVQEEYRALLDAHPDDLTFLALYARTLKGTDTSAAIKLLDKILQRQPDDVQAHLKLVEIYSAPAFRDDRKLATNATAYFKACPSSLGGYPYITRIEDPELIRIERRTFAGTTRRSDRRRGALALQHPVDAGIQDRSPLGPGAPSGSPP